MKVATTETLDLTFDGKLLTCKLIGDVEIEVHHVEADYETSKRLTEEKKYIVLVLASKHTSITIDAQKKSMMKAKYENMVAQAIVVHSLAQRILGNFMIRFIKFPVPCELFSSKEKALDWLNMEWDKSMKK